MDKEQRKLRKDKILQLLDWVNKQDSIAKGRLPTKYN